MILKFLCAEGKLRQILKDTGRDIVNYNRSIYHGDGECAVIIEIPDKETETIKLLQEHKDIEVKSDLSTVSKQTLSGFNATQLETSFNKLINKEIMIGD